jgi:hypothetical protein
MISEMLINFTIHLTLEPSPSPSPSSLLCVMILKDDNIWPSKIDIFNIFRSIFKIFMHSKLTLNMMKIDNLQGYDMMNLLSYLN